MSKLMLASIVLSLGVLGYGQTGLATEFEMINEANEIKKNQISQVYYKDNGVVATIYYDKLKGGTEYTKNMLNMYVQIATDKKSFNLKPKFHGYIVDISREESIVLREAQILKISYMQNPGIATNGFDVLAYSLIAIKNGIPYYLADFSESGTGYELEIESKKQYIQKDEKYYVVYQNKNTGEGASIYESVVLDISGFIVQDKEPKVIDICNFRAYYNVERWGKGTEINDNNVRLRDKPSTDSNIIKKLTIGNRVKVMNEFPVLGNAENEYGYWVKVQTNENVLGWVWYKYLKTFGM